MRYKFLKVKDKRFKDPHQGYLLLVEDVRTLKEHEDFIQSNVIEEAVLDYFHSKTSGVLTNSKGRKYPYVGHLRTSLGGHALSLAKMKGITFHQSLGDLEGKIFQGKIKVLLKYGNLLIRESGTYFTIVDWENYDILDTITSDSLVYPQNYNKNNIKITQWKGGTHYYAKIGNATVVDNEGNQKWNTEEEAMNASMNYLKTLI